MSRWRRYRAQHKDKSHGPILKVLAAAGCGWLEVSSGRWGIGQEANESGAPDLIVWRAGLCVALELKTPGERHADNRAKKRRLDKQEAFRAMVRAMLLEAYQVETPIEALASLRVTAANSSQAMLAAGQDVAPVRIVQTMLEEAWARLQEQVATGRLRNDEPNCKCGHGVHAHHLAKSAGGNMCCGNGGKCECYEYRPLEGEAAAVAMGVVPPPKSAPEEQVAKWLSGAKKAKKGT